MSTTGASTSGSQEDLRPQAGPLPSKRGEIGYKEDDHHSEDSSEETATQLPARHPADRDSPMPHITSTIPNSSTTVTNTSTSSSLPSSDSSTVSLKKPKTFFSRLHWKNSPSFGGLRLGTLLLFNLQLFFFIGTIVGWVFAAQVIGRSSHGQSAQQQQQQSQQQQQQQAPSGGTSNSIFVHVVFGVTILAQLLFIERRIFRLRAERYTYLHPGEMLPTSRFSPLHNASDASIAFSPWNRPPLPTYAATLAQSGVGTGDVEDHMIAIAPPPAYGNTRGSRLLLAGFLRDSLRAQRPMSAHSQMSQQQQRPVSYASHDGETEEHARARRLEETLAALERPTTRA